MRDQIYRRIARFDFKLEEKFDKKDSCLMIKIKLRE